MKTTEAEEGEGVNPKRGVAKALFFSLLPMVVNTTIPPPGGQEKSSQTHFVSNMAGPVERCGSRSSGGVISDW